MRLFTLASLALAGVGSAQELPKQARDRHEYDLIDVTWSVSVDPAKGAIKGDVVNTVTATKESPTLVFDCAKLTVDRVLLDGKAAKYRADGKVLSVVSAAKKGGTQRVEIVYHGLPEAGIYFVPAARAFPAKTPIVYTQGEMEDNRYWLPTYDSPDDKATSHGTIAVPVGWNVLSNGRSLVTDDGTFRWAMDKPHSTYLIAFVAGPYSEVPDGTDPVPVSIWTPTGLEAWGKNAFGGTDAIVRFYGKLTGTPYAWPKYAQSAVADFMFGGMENVSATTQTLGALFPDSVKGTRDSTGLDAHELAHQWFGDLVTTPRWDDIWINEGWATFLPHFWAREKQGEEEYALERYDTLEAAKGAMRGSPTRTMVWDGWKVPMEMFDGFAYPGGAARMFALLHAVGEERFWKATKAYLAEYGGKNVDTAGFFASYSKNLGVDLGGFERQWFRTPGAPPKVVAHREAGKVVLEVTAAKGFVLPLDVWALGAGDDWEKHTVEAAVGRTTIDVKADGPILVDAEAFLPIDVEYAGLTPADLGRQWTYAPNLAQKMRLADGFFKSISPAERNDGIASLVDNGRKRLAIRLIGWATDPRLLLRLAEDPDERLAQAALGQMGAVPENAVLKARLKEVWGDRKANPDLRFAALGSLWRLTKDVALIDDASSTDRFDDGYRVWALDRLAEVNPDHARDFAMAALKGGTTEPVRLTAIRVLGRVKDRPGERVVFGALAAMMTERSNSPLRAAIGALADYGDPAAIPILETRKDHGLHFVRGDVARAIERLKR